MRATDLESLIALDGEEGDTGELVLADIQRAIWMMLILWRRKSSLREEKGFKACGQGEMGVSLWYRGV